LIPCLDGEFLVGRSLI